MGLYGDLTAWTVFGLSVHGLAQGIRQKPLGYKPIGFLYSAIAFLGVGLVVDNLRNKQAQFLDRRLEALLDARKARGIEFKRSV